MSMTARFHHGPLFAATGVDGNTGTFLAPPVRPAEIRSLLTRNLDAGGFRALAVDIDPLDLTSSGWGVVFAEDVDESMRRALTPLLAHRRRQAGERYRELVLLRGESGRQFLARYGVAPGPLDPRQVPYYLLLVGDPRSIPFHVQAQLCTQHAVGRLSFTATADFAAYARGVLSVEGPSRPRPRRAVLFGVENGDDRATTLIGRHLVQPLEARLLSQSAAWTIDTVTGEKATKTRLADLLGAQAPSFLLTAGHGLGFASGEARQELEQGALLCADWPGPRRWCGQIPERFYFAGADVDTAGPAGLVSLHLACHSLGTPERTVLGLDRPALAPRPFIAALPQRLLASGALAAIGHVGPAWGYSFLWPRVGSAPQLFENVLRRLLDGHRVGHALEYFSHRYAQLSCDLVDALDGGPGSDEAEIARLWTAREDARSYALLGDPAVRLAPFAGSPPATIGPRVRGGARRWQDTPATVRRYTDVTAPRRLGVGRRGAVTVRLTLAPDEASSEPRQLEIEPRQNIEVRLHADPRDFELLDGSHRQLRVEPDRDSEPVAFHVRGRRRGRRELVLDFRQGLVIGSVRLEVELIDGSPNDGEQRLPPRPLDTVGTPIPTPDLDLRVILDTEGPNLRLRYVLHAPGGAAPFHHQAMGQKVLRDSPQHYRQELLRRIETATDRRQLEAIGHLLYEELFAAELRAAYRRFRGSVRSLQITSDEPWIPWELVRPFDAGVPGDVVDDDFLARRFRLCRWLAGPGGPATEIRVPRGACAAAPRPPQQPHLPWVTKERLDLCRLFEARKIENLSPHKADLQSVEALLDAGGLGLWHVSAHGTADPARLLLDDGRSLEPSHVHGRRQAHLASDRPLVFLNACRAAQQGWSLTRLDGWVGAFVDRGRCGALVAPWWSVEDAAARQFSSVFYSALQLGADLSGAVEEARRAVAELDPVTALAYSLYGHPHARVLL